MQKKKILTVLILAAPQTELITSKIFHFLINFDIQCTVSANQHVFKLFFQFLTVSDDSRISPPDFKKNVFYWKNLTIKLQGQSSKDVFLICFLFFQQQSTRQVRLHE